MGRQILIIAITSIILTQIAIRAGQPSDMLIDIALQLAQERAR